MNNAAELHAIINPEKPVAETYGILRHIGAQIIMYFICGHSVLFICPGFEKIQNTAYIFKILVVVNIHKPLAFGTFKPRVPCGGKIAAPIKLYNFIGVFLHNFYRTVI
jgi:hypothetical protein